MAKKLIIDQEKCTGCRACELACSVWHDGVVNPVRSRIRVVKSEWQGEYVPVACRQCESPVCMAVCPMKAISKDEITGEVAIDHERCISCQSCVKACPYGGVTFDPAGERVIKCDLCGGDPQCVRFCETEAIIFKEEPAGVTSER